MSALAGHMRDAKSFSFFNTKATCDTGNVFCSHLSVFDSIVCYVPVD